MTTARFTVVMMAAFIVLSSGLGANSQMTRKIIRGVSTADTNSCTSSIQREIDYVNSTMLSYVALKTKAEGKLLEAKGVVVSMGFMTSYPANMSYASCQAAAAVIADWQVTGSDSEQYMELLHGVPVDNAPQVLQDIANEIQMPANKTKTLIDSVRYSASNEASGKRAAWMTGNSGWISMFRFMFYQSGGGIFSMVPKTLSMGFIHQKYSLATTHAPQEVDTPELTKECEHFWFFYKKCNTIKWTKVTFKAVIPTPAEHEAFNTHLQCRAAHTFAHSYAADIALAQESVPILEADITQIKSKISQYQTQLDKLEAQLQNCPTKPTGEQ